MRGIRARLASIKLIQEVELVLCMEIRRFMPSVEGSKVSLPRAAIDELQSRIQAAKEYL